MNAKKVLFGVLVFSLSLYLMSGTFEKVKELSLPSTGLKAMEIDCGPGYLKVKGDNGRKQIEAKATIQIKGMNSEEAEDFIKDKIELKLEKRGSQAVLIAKVDTSFFKRPKSTLINLDVFIPAELALEVDDGSGLMEITNIENDLEIDDGSGSIGIEKIKGDVEIDDGSGAIKAIGIGGDIEINDGSGTITVSKVKGNVKVDDGSGEMNITDINGSVVVKDGSGNINIDGVEKDVLIKSDGSGSLSIENVKGTVKTPKKKKHH